MRHIFGPVPSRRLGLSLGIDIIPAKTCTLNCVYCQLGPTACPTLERKSYVTAKTILAEITTVLKNNPAIDYLTFSGSGEPTLNSEIGKMIGKIKEMTPVPVAVITNATLLTRKKVRQSLFSADVVLPSLDAVSEPVFRRINRPHPNLNLKSIIEGLRRFGEEYPGKIWLEVMLVKGVNDSNTELNKIRDAIKTIRVDKVHLNTVVRPPAERRVQPLNQKELEKAAKIIANHCEIIAEFTKKLPGSLSGDENTLLSTLRRRPLTLKDIAAVTNLTPVRLVKILEGLTGKGLVKQKRVSGKTYYVAP
ncbi:MAG: radical SAM protein [Candidatus Omnitrophota bacterium]